MPSGSDSRGPNKNSGAKSAKAIKAANKNSRPAKKGKGGVPAPRQIPWLSIGAGVAVLALIAVLGINLWPKVEERQALEPYKYSSENKDPSDKIDGVLKIEYPAGQHVDSTQRVAYDQTPPFGGPHDATWANCTGTVYADPIRTENAVHSLEHGAIWITYNPDLVDQDQIDSLAGRVNGKSYMLMSPYPGQSSPISLQSWGHRLEIDKADDDRIDQFITALNQNPNVYPEVGASCTNPLFTPSTSPFDPTPPAPTPSRWTARALPRPPTNRFPPVDSSTNTDQSSKPSQRTALLIIGLIGAIAVGFALGAFTNLLGPDAKSSLTVPASDSVDVGFAQDMSVHHSQAVDMASIALTKSTDNDVRTLAFDILTTQQNQLGQMQAWLTMWDQPLSKVGPYMEWMSSDSGSGHGSHGTSATMDMSHSGPVDTMPGMASPEDLAALRAAEGLQLDTLFLQLMLRHHEGGLPMMEYAAADATEGPVRSLAQTMVNTQQSESKLMTDMLAARGAVPLPMN